jgi:2-amino-4-hydroxy-6-hydroxymethyldihydropteridine diphosphokinase
MQTAYIGMGSNQASVAGQPEATLVAAAKRLSSLGYVVNRSSLYSTKPVGFADQPRFVNAVIALETELEPRALLEGLLAIEKEFGRDRSAGIRNGPRTLDLDILIYGDRLIRESGLEVPHPRLGDRAFVLIPLCEIDPDVVDVTQGKTVTQLLYALQKGSPGQSDEVISVQSDIWRPGVCRDNLAAADSLRARPGGPDDHGRG